jgi:hypothetical protein
MSKKQNAGRAYIGSPARSIPKDLAVSPSASRRIWHRPFSERFRTAGLPSEFWRNLYNRALPEGQVRKHQKCA